MQRTTSDPTRVMLHGEWTMNEASERLKFLVDELNLRLEGKPRPDRAAIDLAGVTEVDACGCQLLALFLEHLKGHGIIPEPGGITPQVSEMIQLLGCAAAFAASSVPEEKR